MDFKTLIEIEEITNIIKEAMCEFNDRDIKFQITINENRVQIDFEDVFDSFLALIEDKIFAADIELDVEINGEAV